MMQTPLYDEHCRLGARMTEFAGWEMPLCYSSITDEVRAVRTCLGIFDLSHMGELSVHGPGALQLLQRATTNDASKLDVGKAQYSLMCDEHGGVIDDLIVYRTEEDRYILVVNAANTGTDLDWLEDSGGAGAEIRDISMETGLLAVQGPNAQSALQTITDIPLDSLRRFGIMRGTVGGIECRIARTGYTGEDGFEIYCSASDTPRLWVSALSEVLSDGGKPIGLGARDILRLEAGYPLYGHELSREVTPVEARLLWTVKFTKGDFTGREAICQQSQEGPEQLLVGLEALERCIPRHGYAIECDGRNVGMVTSGTFSPTLGKGIAMGYVDTARSEAGTQIDVLIRQKPCSCRVVELPFYRAQYTKAGVAQTTRGVRGAA